MDVRGFLRLETYRCRRAAAAGALSLWLAACSGIKAEMPPREDAIDARALIEASLPKRLADRAGWVSDLYVAFTRQSIAIDRSNVCAVAAVIAQESGFRTNPTIPGLPAIAWREIGVRADRAHVPLAVVRAALSLTSKDGRSYAARIDVARTEKDLSDVFEDFIGSVPLGESLFSDKNPIRTRGPMQVNVDFVRRPGAGRRYPYPVQGSLEDELFTRRGGLFFGVAHLLDYRAPYDAMIYRFADFNAGQYASRNAALQTAIATAAGRALTPDGALLAGDGRPGATESALDGLSPRLGMSEAEIHAALERSHEETLESSRLYIKVFAMADSAAGHPLPRASLPHIELHGPKISRSLTTVWYARRVNDRFQACLSSLPATR